jgi:hypothetical protein
MVYCTVQVPVLPTDADEKGRICVEIYSYIGSEPSESEIFGLNLVEHSFYTMAPPSLTREQVASAQLEGDYAIKSDTSQPKLDTSQWPLLLKNYDKLLVRSSHFTPIPSGCSPLKRDITTYIKCVPSRASFLIDR